MTNQSFKSFADLADALKQDAAERRAAQRAIHEADIKKAANLRRTRAMRQANAARKAAKQAQA